MKPEELN